METAMQLDEEESDGGCRGTETTSTTAVVTAEPPPSTFVTWQRPELAIFAIDDPSFDYEDDGFCYYQEQREDDITEEEEEQLEEGMTKNGHGVSSGNTREGATTKSGAGAIAGAFSSSTAETAAPLYAQGQPATSSTNNTTGDGASHAASPPAAQNSKRSPNITVQSPSAFVYNSQYDHPQQPPINTQQRLTTTGDCTRAVLPRQKSSSNAALLLPAVEGETKARGAEGAAVGQWPMEAERKESREIEEQNERAANDDKQNAAVNSTTPLLQQQHPPSSSNQFRINGTSNTVTPTVRLRSPVGPSPTNSLLLVGGGANGTGSSPSNRLVAVQRWKLGHQSFDCTRSTLAVPSSPSVVLSNSCGSLEATQVLAGGRRVAIVGETGVRKYSSSARYRINPRKRSAAANSNNWSCQSSIETTDPVDLCQIGRSFMRVNGTLNQFRGLLKHANSLPSSALPPGVVRPPSLNQQRLSSTHNNTSDPPVLLDLTDSNPVSLCNYSYPDTADKSSDDQRRQQQQRPPLFRTETRLSVADTAISVLTSGGVGVSTSSARGRGLSGSVSQQQQTASGDDEGPPESVIAVDAGGVPNLKTAVSQRLVVRQELYAKRRRTSDLALVFALLGIGLMIIENELTALEIYQKDSLYSYATKTFILLSTLLLLLTIVHFHFLEIRLFMNDNSAEDWRIAMTNRRMVQMSIELAVCSICPIPGDFTFEWTTVHSDGKTVTTTDVPIDVLLSVPMFLRFYLICRTLLLHSRLFTDASSRSIGALNRVNFNARFILKTLMTLSPGTVLLVVTASLWVIAAWVLRICERYHVGNPPDIMALKHQNYLNSLWLIAITFLSVGYGDIVPNTYCGRGVAVCTGIMGVCTSSLVVAVIARKLELTRAEKHVHNFMMDTQLTKRLKHAAANVLRETWMIYRNRRLVEKIEASKIRQHQRKFLLAIYELRRVRRDQRKLQENSMTLGDIAKTSLGTYELVSDLQDWQASIDGRLDSVERRIDGVHQQLAVITELLTAGGGGGRSPANGGGGLSAARRRIMMVEQPSDDPSVRSEPAPAQQPFRYS